jgi:hypothetical protein
METATFLSGHGFPSLYFPNRTDAFPTTERLIPAGGLIPAPPPRTQWRLP